MLRRIRWQAETSAALSGFFLGGVRMKECGNFTEGKILAPLIRFALPVLFAILLQTMYGAVDMIVVGQFASVADVSAVSTGTWVMHTLTAVVMGLSMGTTILIGRKIGEGSSEEAGCVIGSAIWLFSVLAALFTVIMLLAAVPCAKMMQTPPEAFDKCVSYIRICSLGLFPIVAYNVLGSVFRGMGDSKTPLLAVAIACAVNIAGDILLVAGFGMASAGAAWATVASQSISVLLSFLIIKKRGMPFPFRKKHMAPCASVIRETISLGLPIACQDLLVCISFLVLNAIVNSLGVVASAGVGVAEKICSFIMLVPSAYMQSMSAFVAQNIGAGKRERARKALLYGIETSLAVGVVMAYTSFFHGDIMASLFAKDTSAISAAWEYLKAYSIDCMLVSFLFCFVGYFNGCGRTKFVMIQGIAGAFGVRVPASYIMSQITPVSLFKIGLATPMSTVLQITMCGIYFAAVMRKEKKHGVLI